MASRNIKKSIIKFQRIIIKSAIIIIIKISIETSIRLNLRKTRMQFQRSSQGLQRKWGAARAKCD